MKILIIHFRSAPPQTAQQSAADALDSAGTDGVSLEMYKRQKILTAQGHEVCICSAYDWADYSVPELEFDTDKTRNLMKNMFGGYMTDYDNENELKSAFDSFKDIIKGKFTNVVNSCKQDMIFVHNMLCLPIHPAASVAFTELIKERSIPVTAIHHDILSEGAYKFEPSCDFAQSILNNYYPPKMENLIHWTINTRNKIALQKRGVEAEIIHDAMDFDFELSDEEHAEIRDVIRKKFKMASEDIVLMAAARIVPNKQTELAGHLTAMLEKKRSLLENKTLYNGEKFTSQNKIVFVLAGRPEKAFLDYQNQLYSLFDELKINWMYIGDSVRPNRDIEKGLFALHPDVYVLADFVLYPTGWEGFGNQLLEAFASELPVTLFEYPVFKEDIGPKGTQVVSLGDTLLSDEGLVTISEEILAKAADEMIDILTDAEKYRSIVKNNREIGKKYFSFDVMRDHLQKSMDQALALKK